MIAATFVFFIFIYVTIYLLLFSFSCCGGVNSLANCDLLCSLLSTTGGSIILVLFSSTISI